MTVVSTIYPMGPSCFLSYNEGLSLSDPGEYRRWIKPSHFVSNPREPHMTITLHIL